MLDVLCTPREYRENPTFSHSSLPKALILTDLSRKMEETLHTYQLASAPVVAMVSAEVI